MYKVKYLKYKNKMEVEKYIIFMIMEEGHLNV